MDGYGLMTLSVDLLWKTMKFFIKEEKIQWSRLWWGADHNPPLFYASICHIRCVISILQNTEISMGPIFWLILHYIHLFCQSFTAGVENVNWHFQALPSFLSFSEVVIQLARFHLEYSRITFCFTEVRCCKISLLLPKEAPCLNVHFSNWQKGGALFKINIIPS